MRRGLIAAALVVACNGSDTSPPAAADAAAGETGTAQRPPMGQTVLEAWLAAGHYLAWRCDTAIRPPAPNGAHGRHRTCSNDVLLGSTAGDYPVGAAAVKEHYTTDNGPNRFAVSLKVAPGPGDGTWYWYERTGTSPRSRPVADGVAARNCGPDCHGAAPRDNVFERAP